MISGLELIFDHHPPSVVVLLLRAVTFSLGNRTAELQEEGSIVSTNSSIREGFSHAVLDTVEFDFRQVGVQQHEFVQDELDGHVVVELAVPLKDYVKQ
jgi:hypothetical protein